MERRRTKTVPLVVAALAAGAIWLLVGGEDELEGRDVDGPVAEVERPAERVERLATVDEVATPTAPAADDVAQPPAVREALAAAPEDVAPSWAEPVPGGLEVVVVEAQTERRLAGATVLVLSQDQLSETDAAAFQQGGLDLDGMLERFGTRHRAGADGTVRVARPREGGLLLVGKTNEHWALGVYEHGADEPCVLELEPDPPVRVRVIDDADEPIPSAVVALRLVEPIEGAAERERSSEILRFRTGPNGIASVTHLRSVRRIVGDRGEFRVGVVGILGESIERTVDEDRIDDVLELRVPDHGTIAVEVVTPRGAPAEGSFLLDASWDEDREGMTTRRNEAFDTVVDGNGRIVPVALGREVTLTLATLQRAEVGSLVVAGPSAPFETVQAVVEILAPTAFVGRIVEERDGVRTPLADTTVEVRLDASGGSRERRRLRTDGGGRFRYEVEERGEDPELVVRVRAEDGEVGARRFVGGRMDYGDNDIGDVLLVPVPLLAAGRVVAPDGSAIGGVRIVVETRPVGGDRFYSRWQLHSTTGLDGRFRIHSFDEAVDAVRLRPNHADHLNDTTIETRPGDAHVEITLVQGALMRVSLADASAVSDDLRARVAIEATSTEQSVRFNRRRDEVFDARVPAGTYDVDVRLGVGGELIEHFQGVTVHDGDEVDVGSFGVQDVRAKRLRVTDAAGRPVQHARIERIAPVHDLVPGEPQALTTSESGTATFFTREDALEVGVHAAGYRSTRARMVGADETVALLEGIPFTVRLVGLDVRLGEGKLVLCALVPVGAGEGFDERTTARARLEDGRAALRVGGPGTYQVQLVLESGAQSARRRAPLPGFAKTIVEVGLDGGSLDVAVTDAMAFALR